MKQTKCNTLLFSYKETQLYCVRLEGHKGDCRFHPSDKWRETEALMEFMDKCVRKTIERKDKECQNR